LRQCRALTDPSAFTAIAPIDPGRRPKAPSSATAKCGPELVGLLGQGAPMTQIGTDRGARRRKPLWLEALIVMGVTGLVSVVIGLLPGFQR